MSARVGPCVGNLTCSDRAHYRQPARTHVAYLVRSIEREALSQPASDCVLCAMPQGRADRLLPYPNFTLWRSFTSVIELYRPFCVCALPDLLISNFDISRCKQAWASVSQRWTQLRTTCHYFTLLRALVTASSACDLLRRVYRSVVATSIDGHSNVRRSTF